MKIASLILAATLMACASAIESPESLKALNFQQAVGSSASTKVLFEGEATWQMDPANPGTGSLVFKSSDPSKAAPFGGFLTAVGTLTNSLGIDSHIGDLQDNYWTYFENGVNALICLWTTDNTYATKVHLGLSPHANMTASNWTPYGVAKSAWIPSALSNKWYWMPYGDIGPATGSDPGDGWVSCARLFITNDQGSTSGFNFQVNIVGEDQSTTQPANAISLTETVAAGFIDDPFLKHNAIGGNTDHPYPTTLSDLDNIIIYGKGFKDNCNVTKVEYQDTDSGTAWTNWPINTTDTTDAELHLDDPGFSLESTDANYGFWLRISCRGAARKKVYLWIKTINIVFYRCPVQQSELGHAVGIWLKFPGAFETGATNNQCPSENFSKNSYKVFSKVWPAITQEMIDTQTTGGGAMLQSYDSPYLDDPAFNNLPIYSMACAVDIDDSNGVSNFQVNPLAPPEWNTMYGGNWMAEEITDDPIIGADNIHSWYKGVIDTAEGGQHDADNRNVYDCEEDVEWELQQY